MIDPTVIIDVSGGIAYVASAPQGITVIIRDYDNCEYGTWEDRPDFCPDESDPDPYQILDTHIGRQITGQTDWTD